MRLFYIGICMVIVAMLLAFTVPAFADGYQFSVSGQVIDRYGNPLPGADVTLVDNNYNALDHKMTNDKGEYDFVNANATTGTFTLMVSYTDSSGAVHKMPAYFVKWFDAKGIVVVPKEQTMIPDYPLPTYGYVYGAIQTDASSGGSFINGIVYLADTDDNVTYYEIADRTDGKGSFEFYVPPGAYVLYAQHWENGIAYESPHKQITVGRNTGVTDVSETLIVMSLTTPASSPNPAAIPVQHSNRVNGTVVSKDGVGVKGATVTLLETADNGTGFVPMKDSNSNILAKVTDDNGDYEFDGVVPTTDDGQAIQTKKGIEAVVSFTDSGGASQVMTSGPEPLYYPDLIMSYGGQDAARSVVFPPVTLPITQAPQSTASATVLPKPTVPSSGVAVVPLLAALAAGLVCILGLYVALNRKG